MGTDTKSEGLRGLRGAVAAPIALFAATVCVTAVWAVASPGPRTRPAPRLPLPTPRPETTATLTVAAPLPPRRTPLVLPTVSIVTLPPDAPLPRPGRNQFLHLPVRTTVALVDALRKSPRLRRLYARHFGIPEDRVVEFTRDALVLIALPRAMSITTFGARKDGTIFPIRQRLPRGALVWATRSGEPILKWQCSNPIGTDMPGTKIKRRPIATATQPVRPAIHTVGVDIGVPTVHPEALVPWPVAPAPPDLPGGPPIDVAEAPEVSGEAVAEMRSTPHRFFTLRGGIPYAGLSGLTSYLLIRPTPRTLPNPTAVPEPGTLPLVALAGGATLLLRRRRGGG